MRKLINTILNSCYYLIHGGKYGPEPRAYSGTRGEAVTMAAIVRQSIQSDAPSWPAGSPASPAVRMGDLLFTSGQIAVDADFQPLYPGDVSAQTRHAFDNIRALVDAAGGSMHDVLELMVLVRDPRDLPAIYDIARD